MEPKIRIKGFQREWKELAFSDSFDSLKNNSLSRAELSESGSVYNIHYGDVLISYNECVEVDKEVKTFVKDAEFARKLKQSCAIKNGDIIFADAAEDNTVGKCTEVIAQEADAIVSGLHTIPCRPKKEFASRYLGYYLNSNAFHDQLLPHIQGTKISSISKRALAQTYISYPSDKNEQQAIASYFQHLDSLIQSTTKKIESLKQVKAASLQSMFPQEGETKPRVRFMGFEGEWEKVSLNDILEERNEKSRKTLEYPLMAFIAYKGVAPKGERYDRSALVNDVENKIYKKTEYGDFIYSSNNLETGSIGLNSYGKATISPVYSIFRCKDMIDFNFIGRRLICRDIINEMIKWRQGVIYGQWRIHEKDFLTINILLPSYQEQTKIGDYFTNLDTQISLQTQRLEKLKQIKSACLDNMFI